MAGMTVATSVWENPIGITESYRFLNGEDLYGPAKARGLKSFHFLRMASAPPRGLKWPERREGSGGATSRGIKKKTGREGAMKKVGAEVAAAG